jgi:hypothetical protein
MHGDVINIAHKIFVSRNHVKNKLVINTNKMHVISPK